MATREIIEMPDSKSGDINELRDKKIALASKASGATDITAQCEYLIKNGQTGEFMNVLKSYIDESVRSALGALVNNLDKGSSIKSVLATDSSNDLGSITPANLTSVLGANLGVYIKSIRGGSIIGNGFIYIRMSYNGNIGLKIFHGGSAHSGDGPIEVNIGRWSTSGVKYKYVSGSGKVYYKDNDSKTQFIISPNTTVDYNNGFVISISSVEVAKVIDTSYEEYQDFNTYAEATEAFI